MFETLEDQMKIDEQKATTKREFVGLCWFNVKWREGALH